jgi:serine phosphatase RsbU (regulator of sigma subunit)
MLENRLVSKRTFADLFQRQSILPVDGYTEALSPESEEFGSNRLAESCAALQGEALEVIARRLEREVDAFCGASPAADDRTLVMVRRKVEGEG